MTSVSPTAPVGDQTESSEVDREARHWIKAACDSAAMDIVGTPGQGGLV
jgi:hypothetical protein